MRLRTFCVGFSLIELATSMTIAGVVLSMVAGVFSATSTGSRTLEAARASQDEAANARRWLAGLFNSVSPPVDSQAFLGTPTALTLTARIRQADGAFAAQRVRIRIVGGWVVAETDSASTLRLAAAVGGKAFEYLPALGGNSQWTPTWSSASDSPVAVRMRVASPHRAPGADVDTLVFAIRDRR
jgi:Tfp pilus assembly protein PilW